MFPVRHPERQRTPEGEEEEGGRGGEEEGLMMSHFDWWTVSVVTAVVSGSGVLL